MAYAYKQIEAHDPSNPGLVAPNASVTIFEPGDPAKTPLTLTTLTGEPLPNPVTVNGLGYGPAFMHATLSQVAWAGGGLTGTFESYEGMRDEAIAARTAAETAAANAAVEAAAAIGDATVAAEAAADAADASALAAANSAALVGAPADNAIATAINAVGSETKAALSATYAGKSVEVSKADKGEATSSLVASLPNLLKTLREYNEAIAPPVRIIGLGSSVGVGADTPDPATQSPSAYFTSRLNATLDKTNTVNFVLHNGSVNGSIITDANNTAYAAAKTAAGGNPAAVLIAFGMNDGGPGQYHTGQTYPGVYPAMVKLIESIKLDGGDPIVMTTPHPHSVSYPWASVTTSGWSYPKDGTNTMVPIPGTDRASSIQDGDWAGTGVTIPAHKRYLRVNAAMRQAASDQGVAVIDVERHWFKAVAKHGENALFNGAEYVHPNLLGHQESYHKAIDEFMNGLSKPVLSTAQPEKTTTIRMTKVNNSTRTSTTRTADADLTFTVGANQVWEVEADLIYTTPTDADLRVEFQVPAGTLGSIAVIGPAGTATTFDNQEGVHRRSTVENGWLAIGGIGADSYAKIKGIIKTQATGGTVALKYGQAVASGTSTIYNDTIMRATRIK